MNGDLSRVTFDKLKHYTRVVMQQGRVQLDADFNEQTAILLHYLQTLAEDIIGSYGGPKDKLGFAITLTGTGTGWDKLSIGAGRYYVNGRLCEIELDTPFLSQKDLLLPKDFALSKPGKYLAYLDVWERHITPLDAPEIQEVALRNADTAARTKLIWQVKLVELSNVIAPIDCKIFSAVPAGAQLSMWDRALRSIEPFNRGRLKAEAKREPGAGPAEPCISSPDARFQGAENQLYRVEIHQSGPAGKATTSFKWSRDNATVVAAYKRKDGDELVVTGMRDAQRWFASGDWVELTHDGLELNGTPGIMVQLASVEGESLRIKAGTASGEVFEPNGSVKNPKVRRWNHKETSMDPDSSAMDGGAMSLIEGRGANEGWLELEDGIRIQFQPDTAQLPAPHQYRTGDYWLIPARVATGDVEWPDDPGAPGVPSAVPPHGIDHRYAPLAVISIGADGRPDGTEPIDLRHAFSLNNVCVK